MKSEQTTILIVDDDPKLGDLLVRYLREQALSARVVQDGLQMDAVLAQDTFDLIILDIMLPGEDGLSIARRLRSHSSIPIIMLSARGEDVEKIIGLEVGADDYLAKPFNPRELLARIRAVLRRPIDTQLSSVKEDTIVHTFGPFQLNLTNHSLSKKLSSDEMQLVELTSGEFDLLEAFVKHSNQVLSRDQLIDQLKGYERSPFDRSIDVRVTRLRKKLGNTEYIRTIRGTGYMFIPAPELKYEEHE
ncbi:MAG: response regulator [gamma proteobacterium symbiont of Bathyaustriella thionipta]|nr:response regulator [gamma proteobacterium symbiont of Bathyaustriella thionipta]MCU7948690.1 response regulator [gamma proteobacterium symbiont of Bathyaustriella thionipta]MCU7953867.1 response regulator [gamma proteobacterium symbiont of Bathyaustriella thionipta]MCU7955037.1 response regulator [gamma proteobacterium symbiont of Bathyaustriella thionipta]MCU7968629.1 response regulator [gamma proteobacterium symbiont of Bathyaustriella thionipta]